MKYRDIEIELAVPVDALAGPGIGVCPAECSPASSAQRFDIFLFGQEYH
jgi:hypothetical protein